MRRTDYYPVHVVGALATIHNDIAPVISDRDESLTKLSISDKLELYATLTGIYYNPKQAIAAYGIYETIEFALPGPHTLWVPVMGEAVWSNVIVLSEGELNVLRPVRGTWIYHSIDGLPLASTASRFIRIIPLTYPVMTTMLLFLVHKMGGKADYVKIAKYNIHLLAQYNILTGWQVERKRKWTNTRYPYYTQVFYTGLYQSAPVPRQNLLYISSN